MNNTLFYMQDKVSHKPTGKIFVVNGIISRNGRNYYDLMSGNHRLYNIPENDLTYVPNSNIKELENRITQLEEKMKLFK